MVKKITGTLAAAWLLASGSAFAAPILPAHAVSNGAVTFKAGQRYAVAGCTLTRDPNGKVVSLTGLNAIKKQNNCKNVRVQSLNRAQKFAQAEAAGGAAAGGGGLSATTVVIGAVGGAAAGYGIDQAVNSDNTSR